MDVPFLFIGFESYVVTNKICSNVSVSYNQQFWKLVTCSKSSYYFYKIAI